MDADARGRKPRGHRAGADVAVRFETAEIDRYGPLRGCRPPCEDGITVVAGPNESGKTLYLEGLLQLLEPDVADLMDPGPRVEETPVGRVVVDDGTDRHALGDGTALSDVSRIDPAHLRNLFVVRDSDLALPEGPEYYTTLVEHLGDIHTTEIASVREELVSEGRLTPRNLDLANRSYDTKDVRDGAETLADDIEAYLESVEERGVDETVRERLRARKELASVESRLATQRTAEEVADLEDASERFDEYVAATDAVEELARFDRGTLERLRGVAQDLEHARDDIEEKGSRLAATREEATRQRERLAEARRGHAELQQRAGDVDDVEAALGRYRDAATDGGGAGSESRLAQRRRATVAGLVGAGAATGGGVVAGSLAAILLGVCLLLVAAGAWYAHHRLAGRVDDAERRRRALLQQARDAGFEVETPEDVAPRVREYRDELEGAERRVRTLEARLDGVADRIEELETDLEAARSEAGRLEEGLANTLDRHGVDSIEAYETRLEEKEERQRERSNAEPVLERALGAPGGDDPAAKVDHWESALEEWAAELGGTDVDAEQYDEDELERLETRRAELEARLADLEGDLEEYTGTLEEFRRRAEELSPPPFVDVDPSLDARTDEGLADLAGDLRDLVAAVERNAEVSRRAVRLFDDIRADEERKVATLFDPDGPASEALAHLTGGRYTAVDYDPDAASLAVTGEDGRRLEPRRLSRGTQDQLYLAARLSLARQLLGGDPGFLLLDDPFLSADRTRLRNGFETLRGLTDDGWQVVYLTAKPEVHEEMAEQFDCTVHELEPLEH